MKQNIGMSIKTRREQLDLTQQQVADYVGVSKSAVSRWESGDVANMGIDKLSKLSEVLSVSPLDIINESDLTLKIVPNKNNTAPVPLLGSIAAGSPILAEQNIEDYFNLDKKIKADFCLRIKGDSMINVNIMDGDIVFIKKQEDLDNGEIGAVLVGDSATLKRFYRMDGEVYLQAENPAYKPIVISGEEAMILGKMVASLRQYK
ncbi:MAG TPA: repressor LexA [Proteiniclasticum sp.]|uniref:transcriptional repressor LexA n=1 Tax=Proteiniclasticum sp. TaxID=2053595 RepID=UPI000E7EFC13|nr:transcriptional repressor LexA [Proteiniclasticum sp.]HBW13818.1 repressor LexA [Proteiniclasticum sp.]